jgi:hypothetical protein
MEKINLEVILSEKDIYEFQKSYLFKRVTLRQCLVLYTLFVLFVLLQITLDIRENPNVMKNIILILMPAVIVGGLMLFVKKAAKDMIKTNKLINLPNFYEIDDIGFNFQSENSNGNYKWEDLYKIKEVDSNFFLFISKHQAFIIPKRSFKNEEEIQKFRTKCMNSTVKLDDTKPWKYFTAGATLMGLSLAAMGFVWVLTTFF